MSHLQVAVVGVEDFWLQGNLEPPAVALLQPLGSDPIHCVPVDSIDTKELNLGREGNDSLISILNLVYEGDIIRLAIR